MTEQLVILVDGTDGEIGNAEKLYAHRHGLLHRAVSVCIFNSKGEWLLHKRAEGKYHSGGLWTNACCSHPRPGEPAATAAKRRLWEEMRIDCDLEFLYAFRYRAEVGNELIEHEYDHVFTGKTDAPAQPEPAEASEWKYFSTAELERLLMENPVQFTPWFRMIFERMKSVR